MPNPSNLQKDSEHSAQRIQHDLINSELRYRRLFETAQDGILLVDFKTGMIMDVNPFLINLLGYTKEKFLEKHLWEVGVFKDVAASKENFETLQEKRYVRFENLPLETKNGAKINVEFVANAYKVDGSTIIQCNIRDITDRRKAELSLEESENRFRQVFENGQFGIVLVDENFKFIRANPTFCKMLGYEEKELQEKKFSDITHPDSVKNDLQNVKDLYKGKIPIYRTEKKYIKKSGEIMRGKIVVSVIRTPDKSFLYFLTMVEDITERKLSDYLVKESNQMLQLVIETIPERIFWKDRNLRYLGCNELFAKDAGKKSINEVIGHDDFDMAWKDQVNLYRADDLDIITSGKVKLKYEEPQTNAAGKTIWLETNKVPLRDINNNIVGILGTYSDITERKIIREELLKSKNTFSKIFESSPYALTITRISDGKFLNVNDAFVSLSGISRKVALSSSSINLGVWSDKKARQLMINELKAKGAVESREMQFVTKSRGTLTGLYSARALEIDGEPCILSSIADLSKFKEAEQEVFELKERNEAILSSIGDAVFACDKSGKVLIFNDAAEKLTGIPAKQVIGQRYDKIITFLQERDEKPLSNFVLEVIKRKEIIKNLNHTLVVTANGKKIPISNSIAPIKKQTGDVVGAVVSFRDVSRERDIDRAKTEFVSLASHQLRTPLTAINWYNELLLSEDFGKLSTKQQTYIRESNKACRRMVVLINALLNVARIEMGTFSIDAKQVNIVDVAKSCVSELKPQIIAKKIVLEERYEAESIVYKADPKLLTIIFQNLLSNAVKYTPKQGKIIFKIENIKDFIQISVKDNGIGIPKNQQNRIFTKLFRADNAIELDANGTGLGLYIVKSIIDSVGGKIEFESNVRRGSVFEVMLPVSGMIKRVGSKELI